MGDLLGHALTYAGFGLAVFPIDPETKRPMATVVKGAPSQHDATTELDEIEAWWERWPAALIGHRIAPDVLLLDIDPRHDGHETWAALKREVDMPRTRAHMSGRGDGGGHVWFRRPADKLTVTKLDAWARERGLGTDRDGRWTSGIDILRHEHRYTILPPSPHPETHKPYHWARGRSLNVDPAEMPTLLAELLTREDAPAPTRQGPQWADPDSIADWFSAKHTWADVLEPHRWELVSGDGDSDGSEWRHPQATSSVSATVRHGCLFVYSTNTAFKPTEPDDPHGYTRFAAWSVLEHAGDQKAAGRAARGLKDPIAVVGSTTQDGQDRPRDTSTTRDSDRTQETALQRVELEHLESFWSLRPQLAQIRDFARARRCSPWAMLGVVLARVAAATPPFVTLPPLVGSHLSLNLYVCLVGGSGAGKDAAISAGRDCIDVGRGIEFKQIGLGSGEGILDQYVEFKPADKATGEDAHIAQHSTSVLFVNPEIETVSALKGRSNATLMPMLRDAWMGSGLGFSYANRERRLYVVEHQYRLCLILGSQPTSAGVLLGEQAVGTPQRFVWLPVHDPTAPDEPPGVPEVPEWRLPEWPTADGGKVALGLCDEAVEAIDNARLARLRGQQGEDTPDGHALACREKVAALLAILDGRADVTLEDWSMAGIVQTVSTRTRDQAAAAIDIENRRSNRAKGLSEAERKTIVTEVVDDTTVHKACQRIETLLARQSPYGHNPLKRAAGARYRDWFEEAIDRLASAGRVRVEEFEHNGQAGKRYHLP